MHVRHMRVQRACIEQVIVVYYKCFAVQGKILEQRNMVIRSRGEAHSYTHGITDGLKQQWVGLVCLQESSAAKRRNSNRGKISCKLPIAVL